MPCSPMAQSSLPIPNKAVALVATDSHTAVGAATRKYGSSGTRDPMIDAIVTVTEVRKTSCVSTGSS